MNIPLTLREIIIATFFNGYLSVSQNGLRGALLTGLHAFKAKGRKASLPFVFLFK